MHAVLPVRAHFGALRAFATRRSPSSCRGRSTATASAPPSSSSGSNITFTDYQTVYEHQSTEDLCRSLLVLGLCSFPPFIQNSDWLLGADEHGNGPTATATVAPQWLRDAFYTHFCAGRAPAELWARMNGLRANGVGAILNFTEEPDDAAAAAAGNAASPRLAAATRASGNPAAPLPLRHHHRYSEPTEIETQAEAAAAEAECERRLEVFLASIDTAAVLPGTGFAAVQLSALSGPGLLEVLATALTRGYSPLLLGEADGDGDALVHSSHHRHTGVVDGSSSSGDDGDDEGAAGVFLRLLSATQLRQLEALQGRLERLVGRAVDKGVKLIMEAEEQGPLRPALEHFAHRMMRQHNRAAATVAESVGADLGPSEAAVFLTYDTNHPGTPRRLRDDLARVEREGYALGAQLIGGRTAAAAASESDCLELVLGAVHSGHAEVMVASNSRAGVEAAVGHMGRLGLEPEEAPVYFGQLLGLADSLSFTLGAAGYRVYKHCPFGDVDKVMPYLVRRISKSHSALEVGDRQQELWLVQLELWRRLVRQPVSELAAATLAAAAVLVQQGGPAAARRGSVARQHQG